MIQKYRHFFYFPSLFLVALFGLSFSAEATVDSERQTAYVALNANPLWNYEGTNDAGFQMSTKLGYDMHPRLAVEFETGWWAIDDTYRGVDFGTLHALPALINFPIKFPINDRVIPYLTAGGGAFIFWFNQRDRLPRATRANYDHFGLAAKTGLGLDVFITRHIAVNAETGVYFIDDPDVSTRLRGRAFRRQSNVDSFYAGLGMKIKF